MAGADFASLLRNHRTAASLSQERLAERALVSLQAVSALERGFRKAPYRDTVDRLADALGLVGEVRVEFHVAADRGRARGHAQLEPEQIRAEHNLPPQLTSFVGRERVVAEIVALTATSPMVTIVGPGGAGKTRSAIQAGARSLERWPDGVWFVELASTTFVLNAIAAAVGCPESPHRPLAESVVAYLAHRKALVVLDNCEHVIDSVREIGAMLMRSCPELRVLATSREALSIAGERVYPLPALDTPPPEPLSAEDAQSYGAIALFADRAISADGRFTLTDANAGVVADICRRLDGLPLAIELAAARIKVLAPAELVRHLDDRLRLLARSDRTAPPRQQTIRAMIDWSYDLLAQPERDLFDRLAIFAGGFTLDAATAVCAGGTLEAADLLDVLGSLVDKSLVVAELSGGVMRYRLLESTREYAREKLRGRTEFDALARRHAEAFLDIAQRFDRDWYRLTDQAWFSAAEPELDNWRAALHWSLDQGNDLALARHLTGALAREWRSIAPAEGMRSTRAALATVNAETENVDTARLEIASAEYANAVGEYAQAIGAARKGLALLAGESEPFLYIRGLLAAGPALTFRGETAEGNAILNDALDRARTLENPRLIVNGLNELGTAASRGGEIEAARRYYAQALALCTLHGFERSAASIAANKAEVEFVNGDVNDALRLGAAAYAGHMALRNRRSAALVLCNMAAYLVALERWEDARARGMEAAALARSVSTKSIVAFSLQHLAAVATLRPRADASAAHERAARLLGFVDARLEALGVMREHTERQEYDRVQTALGGSLGPDRLARLMSQGVEWADERAAEEAALQ